MGVAGPPIPGFPAGVEILQLGLVQLLIGEQQKVGPRRVVQQVPVEAQTLVSHIGRQTGRRQGRKPGQLLQRVEIAQPDDFLRGVGNSRRLPLVHKAPHKPAPVGDHRHPIRAQRPKLGRPVLPPFNSPESRAPQTQIDFGSPPQIGAGVPRIDPLQKVRRRVFRWHRIPPPGRVAAVKPQGRARHGIGTQLDRRIHRRRSGDIATVLRAGPVAHRRAGRRRGRRRRPGFRPRRPVGSPGPARPPNDAPISRARISGGISVRVAAPASRRPRPPRQAAKIVHNHSGSCSCCSCSCCSCSGLVALPMIALPG